jgi:hypothetical protein
VQSSRLCCNRLLQLVVWQVVLAASAVAEAAVINAVPVHLCPAEKAPHVVVGGELVRADGGDDGQPLTELQTLLWMGVAAAARLMM